MVSLRAIIARSEVSGFLTTVDAVEETTAKDLSLFGSLGQASGNESVEMFLILISNYIRSLICYYLRKLRSRDELSKYVEMFWPQRYFWSELAGRPFPIRCWRYMWQVPVRWRCYWYGADNYERRQIEPYKEPEEPREKDNTE